MVRSLPYGRSNHRRVGQAVRWQDRCGKCDVEDNEELAAEFGIRNIPTILFFKNGEVVDKLIGAQSKAKFEEKFEAML